MAAAAFMNAGLRSRPSAATGIAAVLCALAVAACANETPPPEIVWDTERTTPSTAPPAVPGGTGAAGTAPSQPSAAPADPSDGDGCREYSQTVIIGGEEQQAYGRVCRQPDGSWRVVQPADLPPLPGPPAQAAAYPVYYPAYYYPPPFFFGSAFFYSAHRHHHHHHRGHRHRR
jgi:hypothetical protein